MIKFDLEKALAGEKVIRRSKAEVEQLKTFEVESCAIICGVFTVNSPSINKMACIDLPQTKKGNRL